MDDTTRAVLIEDFGAAPTLADDLPAPSPGAGEVLVRVQASSVNPIDAAIAGGMLKEMAEHEFPVTLGRDYAGVADQVGDEVTGVGVGDEVFGFVPAMSPLVHDGSWAELIAVSESIVGRKPASVDTAVAGATALAGVTARMVLDALELSEGGVVLVVGAAGGVGSIAVQLAARAGATVVAPALPEDEDYLRGLGVGEVVPREGDVVAAVRERHPDGVDAIADLATMTPGGFDGALKEGGRVASSTNAAGEGPGRTNVLSAPDPELLRGLAQLLDEGAVRVPIQRTYELGQAGEALQALGAEHTRGKLALRVD